MKIVAVALVLLAAAGCAWREHPWAGTTLCELERPADDTEPTETAWLRLLLRGWDPATRRGTLPAVDCAGAQVRWVGPALRCSDGSTAAAVLPDRPLGAADVVVARLGDDHRIVWIVTHRFASGDGLGPVAVVEVRPRRLIVRALGHLRANLVRPRLRLEKLDGREVLVGEGDVCGGADPSTCTRSARLMPLDGERYVAAAVAAPDGACLGPALFDLAREEAVPLPSGWKRRYRVDANLAFGPGGVRVKEVVVVTDFDPRHPATPARPYRRADADLDLRLQGGGFVADTPSLWVRMLDAR